MTTPAAPVGDTTNQALPALIARRAVQLLLQAAVMGGILFAAAGTVRWWNAWAFVVLYLALIAGIATYVFPRNREVIAARGQAHKGTRTFDAVLMSIYTLCYLGLFLVAGMDAVRFGWAPLGWPWAVAGAVLLAISVVPTAGAMAVNPHLETTARIQEERGHEVAVEGPYRVVRHPMYVSMILQLPATALLLGSRWALVPALVCGALMVVRTALEDRMLRQDLPGYQEYADRTRYRLLPRVW